MEDRMSGMDLQQPEQVMGKLRQTVVKIEVAE